MIDLKDWSCLDPDDVNLERIYRRAFTASTANIDDRSKHIHRIIEQSTEDLSFLAFDHNNSIYQLGNTEYNIANIEQIEFEDGIYLLDATSLDFPEILYFFLIAELHNLSFDVLYAEPGDYLITRESHEGLITQSFDLSEDGMGVNMLQRFVHPTKQNIIVVSLGFEGHRFSSLLQSDEFSSSAFQVLIGIPAYNTEWENRSFMINLDAMGQVLEKRDKGFIIAAANDPCYNYDRLERIRRSRSEQLSEHAPVIHIAPFGTKPAALAVAWFAVNNSRVGIIYDFAKRKPQASQGIGKVHKWCFRPNIVS